MQYLVNAAGHNANFLLNVGPMPDGSIQQEFADTLNGIGKWMQKNGETIYSTRGNIIAPQQWGTLTMKNKTVYVHILNKPQEQTYIFIPGLKEKIIKGFLFDEKKEVKIKQVPEGSFIYLNGIVLEDVDTIIQLELK